MLSQSDSDAEDLPEGLEVRKFGISTEVEEPLVVEFWADVFDADGKQSTQMRSQWVVQNPSYLVLQIPTNSSSEYHFSIGGISIRGLLSETGVFDEYGLAHVRWVECLKLRLGKPSIIAVAVYNSSTVSDKPKNLPEEARRLVGGDECAGVIAYTLRFRRGGFAFQEVATRKRNGPSAGG